MAISEAGGVLLANLPADIDAELLSLRFLAIEKNCHDTVLKLNQGILKFISFLTEQALITAFELGDFWILILGPPETSHNQLSLYEKAISAKLPAVGNFLLTKTDMEKLSKLSLSEQSELKMRVLSIEASEDLQTLLSEIGSLKGVIGCLIVGHDGLLIANTFPEKFDAEQIGVWSLGEYMNTEHVMKKMGHERIHQIVNRTKSGYIVVADFGSGLIVVMIDDDELIPVMRKITDLVS